ncbi:MAG: hypothetical protein KKG47_12040 [Proteobacteria bacterium]|nr:hypothetical protein [Pseudomonadota bacterium]MBU1738412.1 hypothetical protein [Pseudomonadota bacterium]
MSSCLFIGTHSAVLDEKSRMVMPAGFRKDNSPEILDGDFYFTPHENGFIIVRPSVVWEKYQQTIMSSEDLSGSQKRQFIRLLCNNSVKAKLDTQYRIVLNQTLRRFLPFENDEPRQKMLVVGSGEELELWPADRYRGETDSTQELSRFINGFDGR